MISALEKIRQPFNINSARANRRARRAGRRRARPQNAANNFAGLEFFSRAFRDLKLEFVPSFANFILVRVGEGQKIFDAMQKQGVIVRPMGGYQLPEWIRISVGTPEENQRCLDALKNSIR